MWRIQVVQTVVDLELCLRADLGHAACLTFESGIAERAETKVDRRYLARAFTSNPLFQTVGSRCTLRCGLRAWLSRARYGEARPGIEPGDHGLAGPLPCHLATSPP